MSYDYWTQQLNTAIDNAQQLAQSELQRQHDFDMADENYEASVNLMNHSTGLGRQTMAIQNQYQIEQWMRENEHNDPSAVRQRYAAAGISPQAAFGQGAASGAGIAGGLSSAPSGSSASGSSVGSSSNIMFRPLRPDLSAAVSLASLESEIKLRDSQARLNDAEARSIEDKIPTDVKSGDLVKSRTNSEIALNASLAALNEAKKAESISQRGYNDARRALTLSQKTSQDLSNKFDKDTYETRVKQAKQDLALACQTYDHNEDKNPLVIQDLRFNLVTQMMNVLSMEVVNRLHESQIQVNQEQVLLYIAQSSKLTAEAKAIAARVEMERGMQGYKKAAMIIDSASGLITSLTRAGAAIATVGISEIGNGSSGTYSSVNGQNVEDVISTICGY